MPGKSTVKVSPEPHISVVFSVTFSVLFSDAPLAEATTLRLLLPSTSGTSALNVPFETVAAMPLTVTVALALCSAPVIVAGLLLTMAFMPGAATYSMMGLVFAVTGLSCVSVPPVQADSIRHNTEIIIAERENILFSTASPPVACAH